KVIADVKALIASQEKPGITEDELKGIVEQIKAKTAMSNGISERAMDAFARAYALGTKPDYKAKMKDNVASAYKVRYGATGPVTVDQFIASTSTKPFVNPTTPVTPIADPEPVKTSTSGVTATTTAPVVNTTTTTTKPAANTTTTVAKPAAAPAKTQAPAKSTTATKKPGVAKKVVAKRGA
ncbi:MAG TPA: hypothetical protein VL501_06280, partial [Pyrinomonadaceae bacterium]|nr:hypothetical protein [Pyrinomonadaceae bacterium]